MRLLHPRQYIKNVVIFLPLIFALRMYETTAWGRAGTAFWAFSLVASAVYILNDIHDVEADRRHPRKKYRPIATGEIGIRQAWWVMMATLVGGALLAILVDVWILAGCMAYFLLNIAYTYRLKQHPIIDVTALAAGYVIRLFVGSVAVNVALSIWIVAMTFFLALFLAFAKRRDDVLMSVTDGVPFRRAVIGYNLELLNSFMVMVGTLAIVCYIMYTVSPEIEALIGSHDLYLTGFFVVLGVFRYLQITFVDKNSGSPTNILWTDRFLQCTIVGWLLSFLFIVSSARY